MSGAGATTVRPLAADFGARLAAICAQASRSPTQAEIEAAARHLGLSESNTVLPNTGVATRGQPEPSGLADAAFAGRLESAMPIAGTRHLSKAEAFAAHYERFKCNHEDAPIRARTVADGRVQFCHQCMKCGQRVGRAISQLAVIGTPPPFDEHLKAHWAEQERGSRERIEQQYASAFWDDYSAYLNTPKWKAKRQKVLDRAAGLCEGCRERGPSEVHHLTYEHAGDELLFELVALCGVCHARCHKHARGSE